VPKLSRKAGKSAKRARMGNEMHRFKHGTLHSGSKTGPVVKSRAQAIAIGLKQSGQSKKAGRVGRKRARRKGTRKYHGSKRSR